MHQNVGREERREKLPLLSLVPLEPKTGAQSCPPSPTPLQLHISLLLGFTEFGSEFVLLGNPRPNGCVLFNKEKKCDLDLEANFRPGKFRVGAGETRNWDGCSLYVCVHPALCTNGSHG